MSFTNKILHWYSVHKRDLPWRNTKNPYWVWISEVILQQTRIQQGLAYYLKFITNYPTIEDMAKAHEDMVLKDWQGLGYYSRARNMHHTAQYIVKNLNGKFPSTRQELKVLKGVGDYTSAAIASICFNAPEPAIDGNVYRVISRVFGIEIPIDSSEGKKMIKMLSETHISQKNPGDYNQAIMDFGSMQCTPVNPDCAVCPLTDTCMAFNKKLIDKIPLKSKKISQKKRYFNYLIFSLPDNQTIIRKRTGKDIWKNLFDFPLIETEAPQINFNDIIKKSDFLKNLHWEKIELDAKSKEYKHVLTHQIIYAKFWELKLKQKINLDNDLKITNFNELESYAFPKLIENYIKDRCVELP